MGMGRVERRALLAIIAVCGGLISWHTHEASAAPKRLPIARDHVSRGWHDPLATAGEQPQAFEANFFPDAVVVKGANETIEYHVELTSRLEKSYAVAWTAFVVDDVGKVITTISKGDGSAAAKGTVVTPSLKADLSDGFYSIRLRAAMRTSDQTESTEAVQFVVVSGGKMREISTDDWYAQSRARLAVRAATPTTATPRSAPAPKGAQ